MKQNRNNNFSAIIPYDMELQRKECKEFLDDLIVMRSKNDAMYYGCSSCRFIRRTG